MVSSCHYCGLLSLHGDLGSKATCEDPRDYRKDYSCARECGLFNYRSRCGLKTMSDTPLAIHLPSAGDDEKTTWGWFNTLWCNNVMTGLQLRGRRIVHTSVWWYVGSVGLSCSISGRNVIVFIVSGWRRRIIHRCCTVLHLCFCLPTHQSSSWTLWFHPLTSDSSATGPSNKRCVRHRSFRSLSVILKTGCCNEKVDTGVV